MKYHILKYNLRAAPGSYPFRFPKGSTFLSAQTQRTIAGEGRIREAPMFWMQVPADEDVEHEVRTFKVAFTGPEAFIDESDTYLCTLQCEGLVLHVYEETR